MSISYTDYDYEDLVDRITEALSDKPGFTDAFESSSGQTLIQLLADTTDHLFYMLERRSQEVFLDTARLDSSIITHASELGYRPRRRVSASGTLLLELVDTNGDPVAAEGNIFIPRGTSVTLGDVSFVTLEDYNISEGQTSTEINVKEGSRESITINTESSEFQDNLDVVIEDYTRIEEFSLEVAAANGQYQDVGSEDAIRQNLTSLSYALPTDRVFDIRFSMEGMRIVFGDDEFGKTPEGTLTIFYIDSSGSEITVVRTGLNFRFDSLILTDDSGVFPPNEYIYNLTNITQIRGGSDGETSAEIARNAPAYIRTNNRSITAFDHEFWTLRSGIGGIADCRAYGEQESDSLVFNMNNVVISYVTADGEPLTPAQTQDLSNYLDNFKILTTHIAFHESNRFNLIADLKYRAVDNLPISNSTMFGFLKDKFADYFSIRRGIIGRDFQRSELMRDIQNMEITVGGVRWNPTDYLDLDIEVEYIIENPDQFFEIYIGFDAYTPSAGDRWTLFINEEEYTITVLPDETINEMIQRMRDIIQDGNSALVAALLDSEDEFESLLRIKSRYFDSVFSFAIDTTDDVNTFLLTSNTIKIPAGSVPGEENIIVPGSAYILDEEDNIIFQDDGEGMMDDPSETVPSFEIDYADGRLISPQLVGENFRFRFRQSPIQNIYPGVGGVVSFEGFDEELNEAPYSRITFLE